VLRILLTNDDGIDSPGIAVLRHALEGLGDVVAMAPDHNASALARSITVARALRVQRAPFGAGFDGLAVDGTPVDCVRIALLGVLGPAPDLVVSGVNLGANMGNDVTYSGTVGAALEAALHGICGIAFSVESREPRHLESTIPLMRRIVEQVIAAPLAIGTTLNVNLPDRPADDIAGLRVTSLGGTSRYDRVLLADGDLNASGEHFLEAERAPLEPWTTSDFEAVEQGFVSLTPIHYELTSREGLAQIAGWPLETLTADAAEARP
jgi:5'-nucleotidase